MGAGGVTVLLDTHALLWFLLNDQRLSATALEVIRDPGHEVLVSAASAYEIATKHRIGKLGIIGFDPRSLTRVIERARLGFLPLTVGHALVAGLLEEQHRDPFDRMLLAQSRVEGLPLVTRDPVFSEAGLSVIW